MGSGVRALALLTLIVTTLTALEAAALPPFDTVMEQLGRARSRAGDVEGRGRIDWGPFRDESLRIVRAWGDPPELRFGGETIVADWRDEDLDVVFRLLGAALSARDLPEALRTIGRTLETEVQTLLFLPTPSEGDDASVLVYALGGPLSARAIHLYVARDTYHLRGMDVPMPEGVYAVRLEGFELASEWFPSRVRVERSERVLLDLRLERVE